MTDKYSQEVELAKRYSDIFDLAPAIYDERYGVRRGLGKSDSQADDWEARQLLGEHQRQAAQRRVVALENGTVSLYQRLGLDDELAAAYDRGYGRPVDEDARGSR